MVGLSHAQEEISSIVADNIDRRSLGSSSWGGYLRTWEEERPTHRKDIPAGDGLSRKGGVTNGVRVYIQESRLRGGGGKREVVKNDPRNGKEGGDKS